MPGLDFIDCGVPTTHKHVACIVHSHHESSMMHRSFILIVVIRRYSTVMCALIETRLSLKTVVTTDFITWLFKILTD